MTYTLHPEAERDLAEALDFYSRQAGLSVAQRFKDEFERVAELLVSHPDLGTPSACGRRVFPFRIFPYSVVYRKMGVGIRVVVVRHQHRRPSYGGRRPL